MKTEDPILWKIQYQMPAESLVKKEKKKKISPTKKKTFKFKVGDMVRLKTCRCFFKIY